MPVPQYDVKLQGRTSGALASSYDTNTFREDTFDADI
jgi:hypothetical protein